MKLLSVAIGLLISLQPAMAIVRRYTDTTIFSGATNAPAWSNYDPAARLQGNLSSLNGLDDATAFDPLGICIPFFQSVEPIPMYLASNGFITSFPETQCQLYCSGEISFNNKYSTSGGIPLIGFYVTDLDLSTRSGGGTVRIWRGTKVLSDGVSMFTVIVDLDGVRRNIDRSGSLTGQVELWANGTILFRYTAATSAIYTDEANRPGTGLIWTARQRVVSNDVGTANANTLPTNIIGIRYDPVPDPCSVNIGCSACAVATGCVWCGPTSECVGSDIVDDVCSASDRNQCVAPSLNVSSAIPQPYYKVTTDYSSPFQSVQDHPNATVLGNLPQVAQLGMGFPYFSFDPNSTAKYHNVSIENDLSISVTMSSVKCLSNSYMGVCSGSDFSYSIVLFSGPLVKRSNSVYYTLALPARLVGDFMCQTNNTASGCMPTFVFQFSNVSIFSTPALGYMSMSAQAALHEDGTVDLSYFRFLNDKRQPCPYSGAWFSYGAAFSGLFRNGNGYRDLSSVLLPWPIISGNLKFTATPIAGCLDCGGRGICDTTEKQCKCKSNYVGMQCESCAPGYYGPQCSPCQLCQNGGVCDEGASGSGFCTNCTSPFSGAQCEVACNVTLTEEVTCGDCGMGYCECGTCVCVEDSGWYGRNCELWADPCRQHTLFGCAVCVNRSELVTCDWCTETSICVASSTQLSVIANRSTCSSTTTLATIGSCTIPYVTPPTDSRFTVITIIVVFACIAVCACLTLFTVCLCRKHPINPLVMGAVPGVADFGFPRREREIIGISRLPIQGRAGRPVQGIPLKQIPMRELVLMQREKRKSMASLISPITELQLDAGL